MKIIVLDIIGAIFTLGGVALGIGGALCVPWLNFVEFMIAPYLHLDFRTALVIFTLGCSTILIGIGVMIQNYTERVWTRF